MQPNNCANVVIDGKHYDSFTEPPALLAQERKRTNFPIRELSIYYANGEENLKESERFQSYLERDPVLDNSRLYDMDYEEMREETFKMVCRASHYIFNELGSNIFRARSLLSPFGYINPSAQTRLSVHTGLFMNAVAGNGTEKQFKYWLSQGMATLTKFFGCFGMTELGHGSNVAGLETTATFDEATDEFVIHTPHTGASKWWIGGAAHSATHCCVLARLIVKGKDYGVQNFVVQLRSVEDHELLPGIALGDIGKKMGRDGIDNGWIQFSHVRIPRNWMLQRYCKVDANGKVDVPPLAQLAYGTLISGRVSMAYDSWIWARRFLTIAIRYSAVRRQFSASPNEPETILLDYPYHQRRLMPLLAQAIAIEAGATELFHAYDNVQSRQASANLNDPAEVAQVVANAKELFILSAGLKAFGTWACADTIDECRQACGGHGYSGYNGFGQGFNDWVVNCTWEGDNNVLALSAGRGLIQNCLQILKGKQIQGPLSYLNNYKVLQNVKLNGRSMSNPEAAVETWQSVAAKAVFATTEKYIALTKAGKTPGEAFEELSSYRFLCARLNATAFQIHSLFAKIEKRSTKRTKPVLLDLAALFAAWSTAKDGALFLQHGVINGDEFAQIQKEVTTYCAKVRDQAIGITDAFGLTDFFINAPIGNYNGDVYNNYFKKVTGSKPTSDGRAKYVHHQLSFFHRKQSDAPYLDEI